MKINDFYSTTDLVLATVIAMNFPIELVDKKNPHKAVFIFKREEELDRLIEEFWKKQTRVEPLSFFNCMKMLKSRIYEK